MQQYMQEVINEAVIELAAAIIIAVVTGFIYTFIYFKNRSGILNFFGVSSSKSEISIFLSRLIIKKGGTEGNVQITDGYSGSAVTKPEYEAGLLLHNKLQAKPLAILPQGIRGWIGKKLLILKSMDVPLLLSPPKVDLLNTHESFDNCIILIGTGVYNSLTHYYMNDYFLKYKDIYKWNFYYTKNSEGERIIGARGKGSANLSVIEGREAKTETAFIMKFFDVDHKITVFICAGLGSCATYGSARYLAQKWDQLKKEFGNRDFGIALLFRNQERDLEDLDEVVEPDDETRYRDYLRYSDKSERQLL